MSCDLTEEAIEDEYSTPDGMTDDEVELLEQEVNLARRKAMQKAEAAGRGRNSVEMAGHKAALEAKKAAHDRFHLRQLQEQQAAQGEDAEAIPITAETLHAAKALIAAAAREDD